MNRAIRTDLAIELREDIKDRGKIDGNRKLKQGSARKK